MKECFSQINSAETIRTLLLDSELNSEEPAAVRQRLEAGFRAELIKQNPKRKVFRLICPDNSEMYLKLFARQRFPFSLFRFYAAKEYRAAHTLEKMGLPMIHYLAWGHLRKGGFCLSEGVRDVRPARRYFFETLRHNPRQQRDFLNALASLTLSLCRNNVYRIFIWAIFFTAVKKRKSILPIPGESGKICFQHPGFRCVCVCPGWNSAAAYPKTTC